MEQLKAVCKNPWCKGTFTINESDIKMDGDKKIYPTVCKKCKSFDTELSGGVEWKDKEYEGDLWDGPHQIKYKVTNFKL